MPNPAVPATLRELVRSDYEAFLALDDSKGRTARRYFDVLTHPGFLATIIYRLSASAHQRGLLPVARLLFLANFVAFGAEVSPRMRAGRSLMLPHPQGVATGAGVVLGSNVKILRNVALGAAGYRTRQDGFPVIGDGVTLGDSASVFGPVTIGDGTYVGTGVTLFTSIPAGAIVVAKQENEVRLQPGVAGSEAPTPE